MSTERVQKILAHAGIASRRKAEEMIIEGLVTINGKVAQLGDKADPQKDSIKVAGKLLRPTNDQPVYVAFHKPKGVISMFSDPEGRATLADFLGKVRTRLFPVGRLDFNSEGLILLTNDGDMAEKLQKAENILRVYEVKVKGKPDAQTLERLKRGTRVEGKLIEPHSVRISQELTAKSKVEIAFLSSGAIDIKAFFEMKGVLTERMVRTAIGQVTLKGIAPGEYKFLKKSQVEAILAQPELGMKILEDAEEKAAAKAERRARFEEEEEQQRVRIVAPRGGKEGAPKKARIIPVRSKAGASDLDAWAPRSGGKSRPGAKTTRSAGPRSKPSAKRWGTPSAEGGRKPAFRGKPRPGSKR